MHLAHGLQRSGASHDWPLTPAYSCTCSCHAHGMLRCSMPKLMSHVRTSDQRKLVWSQISALDLVSHACTCMCLGSGMPYAALTLVLGALICTVRGKIRADISISDGMQSTPLHATHILMLAHSLRMSMSSFAYLNLGALFGHVHALLHPALVQCLNSSAMISCFFKPYKPKPSLPEHCSSVCPRAAGLSLWSHLLTCPEQVRRRAQRSWIQHTWHLLSTEWSACAVHC